jgi:hypothetical protein
LIVLLGRKAQEVTEESEDSSEESSSSSSSELDPARGATIEIQNIEVSKAETIEI